MKNLFVIALSIASILTIAGCSGIPNLFGSDVVTVQTKVIENGQKDVIVVKGIQTIPTSPILPDQQILLSFIVENRDALKDTVATVDLFNAPTMKSLEGVLCNLYTGPSVTNSNTIGTGDCPAGEICVLEPFSSCTGGSTLPCSQGIGICCTSSSPTTQVQAAQRRTCNPDQCGLDKGGCKIFPGEEKPINFAMRTPSEADIKSIKTDVKLYFKTQYNFDSSLSLIVPVVNGDEIVKRQRTGEKMDLFLTKSYSSGPVQIDAQLLGANYILSNSGTSLVNPDSVMTFTMKDRGSGDIVGSQINEGSMEILFPPELCIISSLGSCGGGTFIADNKKFTCTETGTGTLCVNRGETLKAGNIPLYLDETRSSLRFKMRTREPLVEPFRSLQITSSVKYAYELRSSADVTVNPFQNV